MSCRAFPDCWKETAQNMRANDKDAIRELIGRGILSAAKTVGALDDATLALFTVHAKLHRAQSRADRLTETPGVAAEEQMIEDGLTDIELRAALEHYSQKRWEFQVALSCLHNSAAVLLQTPRLTEEDIEREHRSKLESIDLSIE